MATIDVTSTDVYEIARTQGQGDPITLDRGNVAVRMRDSFELRTAVGSEMYPGGMYLIVNNQKLKRVVLSAEAFELLFDVRQ